MVQTVARLLFCYIAFENIKNITIIVQTEAERRRGEAGVKQSMKIRLRSCMYVGMCVWYLELSREPRNVARQIRYQNVGTERPLLRHNIIGVRLLTSARRAKMSK